MSEKDQKEVAKKSPGGSWANWNKIWRLTKSVSHQRGRIV